MIKTTCHCGAVSIAIPRAPEAVTNCNCSICRRYGALWAYYDSAEVRVDAAPQALDEYRWGDESLAFVRCRTCGCMTHWRPLHNRRKSTRMGVNVRNFEPANLGPFRIRFLDGAGTDALLGEWRPPSNSA